MSRIVIEVRGVAVNLGYAVRPYDQIRDARRWRWVRRGKCGRQVWGELTPEFRAAFQRAVEHHEAKGKSDA